MTSSTVFTLSPKRVFVVFLAFTATQFAVGLFVGLAIGLIILKWYSLNYGASSSELLADAGRVAEIVAIFVSTIASGIVAYGMTRRAFPVAADREALASIGWSGASLRQLVFATLAGLIIGAFYVGVLASIFPPKTRLLLRSALFGDWPLHLWAVTTLLVAPLVEEFVFRGVLFAGFSSRWSPIASGSLVTVLFAAVHLPNVWANLPSLLSIVFLGVGALFARVLTGSLVPAVVLHASYNLPILLAVYAGAF